MWAAIIGALQAIPALVKAIEQLVTLAGRISDDIAQMKRVQEFEARRKYARETGDTSRLEDLFGNRS